jgi:glutamine synthetase
MMELTSNRFDAKTRATRRKERKILPPGNNFRVSEFYGENTFDIFKSELIDPHTKKEILDSVQSEKKVRRESVEKIADIVRKWAVGKGATHFCHWFQPLTGTTAEKHDAFITFDKDGTPIETLSPSQLMQGEPDASSFPHGGARATFEARGYTSWDLTSPFFIMEGVNGKTLCIPTAFVTYHGDALDVKTPLLRSTTRLNKVATEFLHLAGQKNVKSVKVTCGAEQEYFLIDKAFYFLRPDLTMTGRTLMGSLPAKNQQLSDHYFGSIPPRVEAFMQELEIELYRLGIPAKTRHNEVAPAQFEMAPIFEDANLSSDHGQLIMAMIKKIAMSHGFVALLHEKPFASVNGSGKHMNWSMADDLGNNLLEPTETPENNKTFLAVIAVIMEAVYRHANALRFAIAGHGNDHRLGGHEAPPSIMSIFLGDTLDLIFQSIKKGKDFTPAELKALNLGAHHVVNLKRDNTDRNRTSPFAFTGNKFEFRAVGASQAVGFPLTILNAAVAEVFAESNELLKKWLKEGKTIDQALLSLAKKWTTSASAIVFNGDGYSDSWVKEAAKRKLPNLRHSAAAIEVFKDKKAYQFLIDQGVLNTREIETIYNVMIDKYNLSRLIEFETLETMVFQQILPAAFTYKEQLTRLMMNQASLGIESVTEADLLGQLSIIVDDLYTVTNDLSDQYRSLNQDNQMNREKTSFTIAEKLMPMSKKMSLLCNELENMIPESYWKLPTYYEMLFIR